MRDKKVIYKNERTTHEVKSKARRHPLSRCCFFGFVVFGFDFDLPAETARFGFGFDLSEETAVSETVGVGLVGGDGAFPAGCRSFTSRQVEGYARSFKFTQTVLFFELCDWKKFTCICPLFVPDSCPTF